MMADTASGTDASKATTIPPPALAKAKLACASAPPVSPSSAGPNRAAMPATAITTASSAQLRDAPRDTAARTSASTSTTGR